MPYSAGTIFLQVVPSYRNVQRSIGRQAKQWGALAGDEFDKGFDKGTDQTGADLGDKLTRESRKAGAKAGDAAGGEFSTKLNKRLNAAIKALPDVPIDINTLRAQREIAKLRAKLAEIRDASAKVDFDSGAALAQIAAVESALRQLSQRDTDVDIKINSRGAAAELTALSALANHLDGDDVTLDVNLRGAGAAVAGLAAVDAAARRADDGAGSVANSFRAFNGVVLGAAALGPALIPVLAGITAGLGLMGFAAIGAGSAFGVLALGLSGVPDAVKEMAKAQDELAATGEVSVATAKRLKIAMQNLSPAGRDFAKFIFGMRGGLAKLKAAAAGELLPGLKVSIAHLTANYGPGFTRFVGRMSAVLGGFFRQAAAVFTSPIWTEFFTSLAKYAPLFTRQLGTIALNLLTTFAALMEAFTPLTLQFTTALVALTGKLAEWAAHVEDTAGFKAFLGYVQRVGPKVWQFFVALGAAIVNLMIGLGPFGELLLDALTNALKFIAAMDPTVLGNIAIAILGIVTAFQLLSGAAAIIGTISGLIGTIGLPVTIAVAAIAGLAIAFVILWTRSEKFREGVKALIATLWEHRAVIGAVAGVITLILLPALIRLGVQAAISGAQTVAIWALMQASAIKAAAVYVAQSFVIIGRWVAMGAAATASAAKAVAGWVATGAGAVKTAAIYVAQGAIIVGRWIAMGAAATLNAAKVAAAWLITSAGAVGAAAVTVAQFGLMIARWAWAGVQSLLHAAKMAAAWIIAMGPVAWVIAAVVALVALIILNWDKIRAVTSAVWTAIGVFLRAVWTAIAAWFVEQWNAHVAAFSAAIGGLRTVATTVWTAIRTFFVTIWTAIASWFTAQWTAHVALFRTILTGLQTAATTVWTAIRTFVTTIWTAIAGFFTTAWNAHVATFRATMEAIRTVATTVWNAIRAFFTTVWTGIAGFFTTQWAAHVALFRSTLAAIQTVATTVWNAIRAFFTSIWNAIASFFTSAWNTWRSAWQTILNAIRTIATTVWNAISAFFRSIWNAIAQFFNNAWASFRTRWKSFLDGVHTTARNIWTAISNTIKKLWTGLVNWFHTTMSKFTSWIAGVWNTIRSTATNTWTDLVNRVRTIFERIKGYIATPLNWVINNALNKGIIGTTNTILGWLKVPKIPNVPTIPGFYQGGVVDNPYGVRPGYTPGRDTHLVAVSGGEAIMRPEWARAVGADRINEWNRQARNGRGYANGGIVPGYASGGVVSYKGRRFTAAMVARIKRAEQIFGRGFSITQGGFNAGGVSASGGTHDRDAIDIPWYGDRAVAALRRAGIIAWHRSPSQGPWGHHIHGIPSPGGGVSLSGAAMSQVRSFQGGGNGLSGGGRDDGPGGVIGFLMNIWKSAKTAAEWVKKTASDKLGAAAEFITDGAGMMKKFVLDPAIAKVGGAISGAARGSGIEAMAKALPKFLWDKTIGGHMAKIIGMVKKANPEAENYMALGGGGFGGPAGSGGSAEQLANARVIAGVGRSMGMSSRDILIALMTSLQESNLRNLKYGDRDSQGLFQQRPSAGWGSVAQITNPSYSSRKFFERLKGVGGRDSMPLWQAAQRVQISAFPRAYAKHENHARSILAQISAGYDSGGWLQPGVGMVANNTGRPEAVLTDRQWQQISAAAAPALRASRFDTDRAQGGGDFNTTIYAESTADPNEIADAFHFRYRQIRRGGVYAKGAA